MYNGDHGTLTEITLRIDDVVDHNGQAIQAMPAHDQNNDVPIDPTIAPFLMEEPPSPTSFHQPSQPSTSSKGFSKSSLSSFLSFRQGSTVSLLRSTRGSDSTTHLSVSESKRRSSDDGDSIRTTIHPNASTITANTINTTTTTNTTVLQHELRKKPSKFNFLKRRASKPNLNNSQDEFSIPPPVPSKPSESQYIFNTPVDPPHPLAHLSTPVPPLSQQQQQQQQQQLKEKERAKKDKWKSRGKKPPEVPPKDHSHIFPLDEDLDHMEGIVDPSLSAADIFSPTTPGASGSASAGAGASGTIGVAHFSRTSAEAHPALSPPTFRDPFSPDHPTDTNPTIVGSLGISPTTPLPQQLNATTTTTNVINITTNTAPTTTTDIPDDQDGQQPKKDEGVWRPPESWAVVDQNGLQNGKPEMTALEDEDDSSDDEARARRGGGSGGGSNGGGSGAMVIERPHTVLSQLHPPSLHAGESIKPLRKGRGAMVEDGELTVRIYRPNGVYHMAALGSGLYVYDLLPALHRRTLSDDKHASRLFLKERGKERILDTREIPLDIISRRMNEAGYSWSDGLILLGGEHMSFLLKFIYRDPDLGIGRRSFTSDPHNLQFQDTEIRLETYDFVDLTGRSLRAIPVILHQHADQIISLKLSRNPMIDLPLDFVEACTQLRDLRLSNMSMRKVPANLTAAKWLRRLDLASNYIKVRELEGGKLHKIPELLSLYLQNNLLKDLPPSFANFRVLSTLNISNNKLRTLPEVVMKISTLCDLDASFNTLEELPDNIGDLHALQRFLFLGNMITKIPNSFHKLRHLEYLDCRRNRIIDLTIPMNLPRLKALYADNNAVHLLDLSMGINLTVLDVSHNEITQVVGSLPPLGSISRCLTTLDLSSASLTTLDGGVLDKLTTLKELKLQHNSLSYIPDALEELIQLERLYCYDNRLIKLPDTIGRLTKLKVLDAHNNNLREVPTTIWECSSLCYLNLSSNFVTTFPLPTIIPMHGRASSSVNGHTVVEVPKDYNPDHVILGHLYPPLSFSLEYLFLSENQLSPSSSGSSGSNTSGLRNIAFLRSLRSLNLSYNDIGEIPTNFFRGMLKLREVYLCGNELTTLPAEDIARLAELHTLYLSGNKLTVLPAELSRLEHLRAIDVSNNNLRYNINNYEFDWNWNYNRHIRYLNLSGNKRLQIKPDNRHTGTSRSSRELNHGTSSLSGFASLRHLRNLGLMDVTVTASDPPDENEDRRIRSTASTIGGLGYGISDCLGREGALTMLDLVHEFPGQSNKALFAMFGNASPPKALPPGISPNRHAKFLHDHFLAFFQSQMDNPDMQESWHLAVDVLRRTFLGMHQSIHNQLFTATARKMSAGSALGGHTLNVDPVTARGGCSGLVVYIEDRKLFAANVGTALGVISRKGQPFPVSKKHDPWNPDELRRMRKSEGWISPSGLVNDEVDVTRSFGYYHMLPVVNACPDIYEYDISDTDEFLIMGNRGLWDYVSFQMAVDIASRTNEPTLVAQKLRDFAMSYGSTGNIMVMAIRLRDVHDKPNLRSSTILGPNLSFPPTPYTPKTSSHKVMDKSVRRAEPEVPPPTGHIALVFTDIRNSTHLWEVNPGMPAAIQLHNDLMRRRLRDCGGYEFKTEGDAFLCSFPTVMAAVWFCLSVQVQLLQENWPKEILECEDGQPIKDTNGNLIAQGVSVRMGIHCGAPLCVQDPVTHRMDYLGPVINRAARVSGLAQGGQIMCSAEVIREIRASVLEEVPKTDFSKDQPPKAVQGTKEMGVVIKDVGERKLKGLEVPEFVSVIYPPGLEARHDLGCDDPGPASVYLDVSHVREMGMLCLRLEALSSGRVFKPSLGAKDLDATITLEDDAEEKELELWRSLEADPENLLPPMTMRWTDHELLTTLDSFTCRIQNALQTLIKRFKADQIDAPHVMALLQNAGLDPNTLGLLRDLLGAV